MWFRVQPFHFFIKSTWLKKKRFTWNVNKSVTRVFSCSGPQNLSTRLMRVMLLHSMYWLSSPTPSFTSRRYSILNTVTDSFPKIFKFPYLNTVLLISTLSLFGSYLKQKERQLYNCEDNLFCNEHYYNKSYWPVGRSLKCISHLCHKCILKWLTFKRKTSLFEKALTVHFKYELQYS